MHVIRGSTVLKGGEGIRLHPRDILETSDPGFAQVELAGGTIAALGASTRLYLLRDAAGHAGSARAAKAPVAELVPAERLAEG